jgi:hypothetical protein
VRGEADKSCLIPELFKRWKRWQHRKQRMSLLNCQPSAAKEVVAAAAAAAAYLPTVLVEGPCNMLRSSFQSISIQDQLLMSTC